eukprot:6363746-Amphidinium_carterae.1
MLMQRNPPPNLYTPCSICVEGARMSTSIPTSTLEVAGLQATTAGAELLNADSLLCQTDDSEALIHDPSQVSTSQLVLTDRRTHVACNGFVDFTQYPDDAMDMLHGSAHLTLVFPITRASLESSLEEDDQVPDTLPSGPHNPPQPSIQRALSQPQANAGTRQSH